jgi:anti-anti-sigma factor
MTVSPFLNIASASNSTPAVIAVNCELVRGTEAQVIENLLPRVKLESVALDLSGVGRMDAAGIAVLIQLYCASVEAGREFSVIDPSSHVLELLNIVGLESILVAQTGQGETDADRARLDRARLERAQNCGCGTRETVLTLTAA